MLRESKGMTARIARREAGPLTVASGRRRSPSDSRVPLTLCPSNARANLFAD